MALFILTLSLRLLSWGLSLVSAPLILLYIAIWLRRLNSLWALPLSLLMLAAAALMAWRSHPAARALLGSSSLFDADALGQRFSLCRDA